MRISTTQLFTDSTRNMLEGQSRLAEIQNKISSGKNFQSLAKDPVGASRVVNLKREMSQLETFQANIDSTRRRLSLGETTLGDITTEVIRARELVIQAGGGALSDSDRVAISYELEEIVGYLANLMNTRDAKGEYLFSGSKGNTQTYAKQQDGTYTYQGDSSQRQIQIASSQYLTSSDTGEYLFDSVRLDPSMSALGDASLVTALNLPNSLALTDADAFRVAYGNTGELTITVTDTGTTVQISDSAGNDLSSNDDYSYTAGNGLLNLPGATIAIALPDLVDGQVRLRLEQNEGNILNTLVANIDALRTHSAVDPATRATLNTNLATTLDQLSAVEQRISEAVASMGGRLNVLDSTELSNSDFKALTQTTLSSVEDLDYASASTELAKRQLALEASFASFAKIQGLSLFNYID